MRVQSAGSVSDLEHVVLLPFDDYGIPFQHAVRLQLIGYQARVGGTKIVIAPGPEGAPDSHFVRYYGTVLPVGDELWMWYLAQGADPTWHQRICLATSRDGLTWQKPELGLVDYGGSTANNLVDLAAGRCSVTACVVFHEPRDPDPARRFKMVFESPHYRNRFATAFSEDGLRWTEPDTQPVGPGFEMGGGIKWNGCYYVTGQGGRHFGPPRQLVTMASYDFDHWMDASCMGFRRGGIPPHPVEFYAHAGEQVHLGAALWNRGNVIVGFYGQWHGHPTNDRRLTAMDLGLVVSADALHYREPIPDFRIVAAAEDAWDPIPARIDLKFPALMQGQGFENIGDQTLFWYTPWPEHRGDGIRVATWTRDRLGYFEALPGSRDAHWISAPVNLGGKAARVFANAGGISEHADFRFEVLDEQFRPLEGFGRDACTPVGESGLKRAVNWQGNDLVRSDGPLRLRANFEGIRPEDLKLYAVYVEEVRL